MSKYKDITPQEMLLLAQTIMDNNATPRQKQCNVCNNIPDFDKEPDKVFGNPSDLTREDPLYKFILELREKGKHGLRADALIKSGGLYYHVHVLPDSNMRVVFDNVEYCEHCGRRLDVND